jgi:ribosome biogenesis GTPase
MTGLVIKSSRNLFTVRALDPPPAAATGGPPALYECRLKGKVLKNELPCYNPLAPGDLVSFEAGSFSPGAALIHGALPRRNCFIRCNRKGELPQALASNVDLVVCVTTPAAPPPRPRFIDRTLVQAEAAGIPACVLLNKLDRGIGAQIEARLRGFERSGYPVLRVSAQTGEGLSALREALVGKLAVLVGQSGVGKSSLVNALCPGTALKTGALNEKYDRGNHTTVQAGLIEYQTERGALRLIDTPGVRQFVPYGIEAAEAAFFMPDLAPYARQCAYGRSCTHRDERNCAVRAAAETGALDPERYESFLRLAEELRGLSPHWEKGAPKQFRIQRPK